MLIKKWKSNNKGIEKWVYKELGQGVEWVNIIKMYWIHTWDSQNNWITNETTPEGRKCLKCFLFLLDSGVYYKS